MITRKQIEYLADLAKLELSESEKELYAKDLNSIVNHMEQLSTVDTEGVEPTVYLTPAHNPLREDRITGSLQPNEILQNGPSVKRNFFTVPKVIR